MASIANDPGGRRRVLFVDPSGDRKAIRLGKVSSRAADGVKYRVEQLLESILLQRAMEGDLAQWVADLEPRMAKKLAAVGLIPMPEAKALTKLGPFLKAYVESRADLKGSTKLVRNIVTADLTGFFGEDTDVRIIDAGRADDFKQHLIGRKLAATTVHKRLQVARSYFTAMRRRKLIAENPFDDVKAAAVGIQDRQRFITREETDRLIAACPNHHWRAIVSLSRYGGLRCPSEVLSLKWADIDWDAGRIVVTSPKTEHLGKASRTIPLFPELRKALSESFELAAAGTEYVVDEAMRAACRGETGWRNLNLRTTFGKIIRRAGLTVWPRMFHNLRASRETELVERFPIQVVTQWLGNTPSVAMRHYLMTTDAHFAAAIATGAKAAQNPAQQAHADARDGSHDQSGQSKKLSVKRGSANFSELLRNQSVAGTGLEPVTAGL